MEEKSKETLGWLVVMAFFIFIGLAVNANVYDTLEGTNYAHWLNIIGWCLVPIVGISSYLWYRKEVKSCKDR